MQRFLPLRVLGRGGSRQKWKFCVKNILPAQDRNTPKKYILTLKTLTVPLINVFCRETHSFCTVQKFPPQHLKYLLTLITITVPPDIPFVINWESTFFLHLKIRILFYHHGKYLSSVKTLVFYSCGTFPYSHSCCTVPFFIHMWYIC